MKMKIYEIIKKRKKWICFFDSRFGIEKFIYDFYESTILKKIYYLTDITNLQKKNLEYLQKKNLKNLFLIKNICEKKIKRNFLKIFGNENLILFDLKLLIKKEIDYRSLYLLITQDNLKSYLFLILDKIFITLIPKKYHEEALFLKTSEENLIIQYKKENYFLG